MKNISFFKKLSLFSAYKKSIKKIEKQLQTDFNMRVDRSYRIYTVLNVPAELIEEPYNLKKSDIDILSQNFIKEYTNQLSRFLNANGLTELYDFYEVEKVEKYSYLLIFGYSLFNSQKFYRNILLFWLPSIVVYTIVTFIYFHNFYH